MKKRAKEEKKKENEEGRVEHDEVNVSKSAACAYLITCR